MTVARRYRLLLLTALIALAFVLRLYRLDAVPLRGDEAFTVRYWAAAPGDVVRTMVERDHEPHPLGTFLTFWVWKSAVGDSPFAMRYLPLLGSLIGVAAAAALGRWLFRSDAVAVLAAALWAIHPFEIWHAQDVRNYALWAGFSALSMALFLRAAATNRPRDWIAYVAAEWVALNTFFLEASFLPVQVLYLLLLRSSQPVFRRAVAAWAVLAVLLIPWFVQIATLMHSGYKGTAERADLPHLLTQFLPTLLVGDAPRAPWGPLLSLAWIALVVWVWKRADGPRLCLGAWLAAWIVLPAALLTVAATRMSVFNSRYLIPVIPALLLLTAGELVPARMRHRLRRRQIPARAVLGAIPLLGIAVLLPYYRADRPKAPDWPALAAYLEHRVGPRDLVLQIAPDPAFGYYYHGVADETSLTPGADVPAQLRDKVNFYAGIWLISRQPDAEQFLAERMQTVSVDDSLRGFSVRQYRQPAPSPDEIAVPLDITFGNVARLRGYTLQGPDPASRTIITLLYWEPLAQTGVEYKVFLHLSGDPGTIWDQDDHQPLFGMPGTREWQPGALYRDPYHLLIDTAVKLLPGRYVLEVGFYDPVSGDRLPVYAADRAPLGDFYTLAALTWPPPAQ